jgi:DnaK suppressor protein
MNDTELSQYRSTLERFTQRVRDDALSAAQETIGGGQTAGELSNTPTHLGDRGTEEYLAEVNAALIENEQFIVDESRAALERIDSGTYGTCEGCEKPVPKERLDAIPYTRFCTACASKLDAPPQPTDL